MKPSAQVTLDLTAGGTTLTPTTAHVRVVIPGGVAGPLGRSAVFANVTSAESTGGLLLGSVSMATLAADKGSFDTTLEMVTLAGQTPETRYILAATDGSNTSVFKLAAPAEGATVDGFLAPIPIAVGSQSLAKPIDLTGAAPESVTRLIVPDSTDGAVYLVDAPPGTKQMHVPTLSAAAKAFVKKGGSDARLLSLAGTEPTRALYTKTAVSSPFSVTIP